MTARRLALLLVLAALAAIALPGSASGIPPAPQPSCSPGPADCGAWHNTNVTVSWGGAPCAPTTITGDTGGTPVSCTWADASGSVTTTVIVRRDASPPAVGAAPDRGPDSNGWYNRPLSVSFSGDDATSGIASCSNMNGSYTGPDSGEAAIRASCTDNAGNTGGASYDFKYDSTPPTVQATADRPPDTRGWYRRELTVSFSGADVTSGLRSCAAPVTYRGPDAPKTAVSGTCMDNAANTSPPAAYELRYDTRPPVLARVKTEITARGIVLAWKASKDTFSIDVVRRPGVSGKKPSTIYSGRSARFTDRRLRKGVKYRYTVTAYDEAGNSSVKGVAAQAAASVNRPQATRPSTPRPSPTRPAPTRPAQTRPATSKPALTRPGPGARVKAPTLLAWREVPKATYYNVQLYRGGQKIMTVWPTEPSFLVPRKWRLDGRTYRLTPGRYRWYVWPGFGERSKNRYGKLIGTRFFVVT